MWKTFCQQGKLALFITVCLLSGALSGPSTWPLPFSFFCSMFHYFSAKLIHHCLRTGKRRRGGTYTLCSWWRQSGRWWRLWPPAQRRKHQQRRRTWGLSARSSSSPADTWREWSGPRAPAHLRDEHEDMMVTRGRSCRWFYTFVVNTVTIHILKLVPMSLLHCNAVLTRGWRVKALHSKPIVSSQNNQLQTNLRSNSVPKPIN